MAGTLVVLGTGPGEDVLQAVASGAMPRQDYLDIADRLNADICSFRQASAERGAFFRKLFSRRPTLGSAISAFLRRNSYSHMFTTGEDVGFPLALLLRLSGWTGQLVMMCHKCTAPRRKRFLRLLGHRAFAHIICVSMAQRNLLVEELGFPAQKVSAIHHPIDEAFFRTRPGDIRNDVEGYVFSCGLENRNYDLLCRAATALQCRFRIAASGFMSLSGFQDAARPEAPPNVTLEGRLSYDELRQTYANARLVVVPVNNDIGAAGGTSILEAMAMGKALVITASIGIEQYIRPGLSAIVTPQGDVGALASAINELWEDPERCDEIGRHNRRVVENEMGIDRYCEQVAAIVSAA
jgi:glycosyltransferase involved in cell wall biosynthesis